MKAPETTSDLVRPPSHPEVASTAMRAVLPLAATVTAAAIFAVDTLTSYGFAVAVLYVLVVLMAAGFCQPRGVVLIALGCMGLTVLSFLISESDVTSGEALAGCLMSLAAIVITTILALQNQSITSALRQRAKLLDLTHDTVFVRGLDDVITYWNRGAEELYGWKKEQTLGKVAHELLQTAFPRPLEEINAELLHAGRWEGELVHRKRDGSQVTVSSRWSLQRDGRGRDLAILETNNDITERKRGEEKLRQAQADLAHVTRVTTLGELTASIAHEVNQPIAATVTNAGAGMRWLSAVPPNIDEARKSFGRIVKDGNRASEVVGRIRALAKKAPPVKERLDINDVIRDVIALTRGEIERHGISLQTHLAGLRRVPADRVQLQQVVLNLIMNAIEAMNDSGTRELRIASRPGEPKEIVVAVSDTGAGLDAQSLGRLFDAFYSTKPHGMGMGLAISRSIVESHGGRLRAEQNTPQGAIFFFTLPVDG